MESIAGTASRSIQRAAELEAKALKSVQLTDKFHRLIPAPPENASSFTALLELPTPQAVELLHSPESSNETHELPHFLHDRAARFSVFAKESNNSGLNLEKPVKSEPVEMESSQPLVSDPTAENKSLKRKDSEKKAKGSAKKSKKGATKSSEDAEQLPCVYVRVGRGQATDSHSLAERARREKINARMKLLQDLVPGCDKISGTASVLDEIINHVQSLQHQVESLSMRLAATSPRFDFNLDSAFSAEGASTMDCHFPGMVMPPMWPEVQVGGNRQLYQQQWHFDTLHQGVRVKEEACHDYIIPENSFLTHDSSANPGR